MAGNAAKASAPYLGNSTLAKTTLPAFASISIAYAEFLHTPQTQLLIGKKKLGEDGLHYILHFVLITMEPMACAGPPSGEWAN